MSLPECPVAAAAAQWPDAPALMWAGGGMTFAALDAEVARLAGVLAAQGVGAGDRMALWQATSPDLIALLFALPRLGAVACPLSLRAAPAQVPALLAALAARAIHADRPAPPTPTAALGLGGQARPVAGRWLPDAQPVTAVFTSGSSGTPKAVLHHAGHHRASARGANAAVGLGPGDRWLLSLPLYHVGGLAVLWRCLLAGAAIALPEAGESLPESLQRLAITHLSVVPVQLRRLLDEGATPGTVREVMAGGDGVAPGLLASAARQGWPVRTSYGCTEAASVVALSDLPRAGVLPVGSGRPLPGRQLRIGAAGEIEIAGATLAAGYIRDGTLSALTGPEGWFATGDMGWLDEGGNLHVTGRRDRMFVSGGENLHAESIERALADLPGVAQAAVVAVADATWGRRPVAFLRWRDTVPPDPLGWMRQRLGEAGTLPRIAWPDRVLPWPADPAGGAMKPDLLHLRQLAVAGD